MKTFKVYHHSALGYEAVKIGFSWPAFFLGPIWMLVKRLWGLAVIWFISYTALLVTEASTYTVSSRNAQVITSLIMVGAYLALWLVAGIKGNAWHATNLKARGYRIINEVQADTPEDAMRAAQSSTP